jgi:hypothetical protein
MIDVSQLWLDCACWKLGTAASLVLSDPSITEGWVGRDEGWQEVSGGSQSLPGGGWRYKSPGRKGHFVAGTTTAAIDSAASAETRNIGTRRDACDD